ncbi:hypothetical protein M0R45_016901 [Rubus argutus]|uniref:Uncharacterized protein n=1 Tax=Rubus argutus TaxID=59490 RepID=A0AAW1XTB2_RUBAR
MLGTLAACVNLTEALRGPSPELTISYMHVHQFNIARAISSTVDPSRRRSSLPPQYSPDAAAPLLSCRTQPSQAVSCSARARAPLAVLPATPRATVPGVASAQTRA